MEKLINRLRQFRIIGKLPTKEEVRKALRTFSRKEKLTLAALLLVFFWSTLSILQAINRSQMVAIPLRGGYISEGIIGTPRFINPVLATSPADRDMTALIYSGLMRKKSDGTLVPDLALKYEMSADGLVYTFTLKGNVRFHDGEPVTVEDILFTIEKVKDSVIKSPYKANWDGITAKKTGDNTVEFSMRQPYPQFLENATLGILPMHIWNESAIELSDANTSPTGTGPYMIDDMVRESSGIINSYKLRAFDDFALGEPYIRTINMRFYQNEEIAIAALTNGEIEQVSSITPDNASVLKEKDYLIGSSTLPRVFGLFFNQNKNQLFTNKVVTQAINDAIDKERIVRDVLHGYGTAIDSPIPPYMASGQAAGPSVPRSERMRIVQENLAKDGWIKGESGYLEKSSADKKTVTPLSFSISTGNAPELSKAAELIRQDLEDAGIRVEVKTFEVGNLNQSVIRPREYDALLFGQIVNHESDLFAFWHSSQRKDPGLNVAMYTNAKVDKILEDAFITMREEERMNKYREFEAEIKRDMPAVFLYSPNFIYALSPRLKGAPLQHITYAGDRFADVHSWYVMTEYVWKIFSK